MSWFQFSLKRLLGAMGQVGLALWLFRVAMMNGSAVAAFAFPIVAGASLGCLFRRQSHATPPRPKYSTERP